MTKIKISKLNETYIKIQSEKSILMEMNEYFTFMAPNYKFDPRFKKKLWDGKIRIFDMRNGLLYKGLYENVIAFAKEFGYTIDSTYNQPDNAITREEILDVYHRHKGPFEPYAYQIDALYYALKLQNAVLLSATSSGKSYFIYNFARLLRPIGKGLIVVPTINLVEQMKKDFTSYGWDVEKYVHVIYSGQDKNTMKPIVISTWQSIFEMEPEWFHQYKYIIGDECHLYKAKSLKLIMENLINCEYRIGTTGTLDDWQTNQLILKGLFGPIKQVVTAKEMIDMGNAPQLKIKIILMHHRFEMGVIGKDLPVQTEWFVNNEKRNKFIRKIVANEKGNKLVLFNLVDKYGVPLYKAFKKEYPEKEIYYISGMTPLKEREEIRDRLSKTDDAILIASYGTYSTGMNVPSIRHVFSTFPGKSKIRILQSIGRALRLHEGKENVVFWDFADKMEKNGKTNTSFNHLEERMGVYYSEKHKTKLYEVHL